MCKPLQNIPKSSIGCRSFASTPSTLNASANPTSFKDILNSTTIASGATNSNIAVNPEQTSRKNRKNERIVLWKLHGTFNKHNTHLTLSAVVEDLDFLDKNPNLSYNEQVLYYLNLPHHPKAHISAGQLGFRKAQRAEYEAGYQVTSKMFKLIEEKRFLGPNDKIELVLKNFGKGREAFLSALQGKEGLFVKPHIVRISDDTKIKFGGTRPKKARRL